MKGRPRGRPSRAWKEFETGSKLCRRELRHDFQDQQDSLTQPFLQREPNLTCSRSRRGERIARGTSAGGGGVSREETGAFGGVGMRRNARGQADGLGFGGF